MQDIDVADLKRISDLIYNQHHYDFRNYATSSFKRRVARILEVKKLSVDCLLNRLSETPFFINEFIEELTVNVTEMFRDPDFWRTMRREVVPAIRRKGKSLKIWHAGCSSGEEVLTMCILLREMGILEDVSVTATDLNMNVLERARSASLPMKNMVLNEKNYIDSGGMSPSLQGYYEEKDGLAFFNPHLTSRITFLRHDLVLGDVFDTFDLIFCRNVMIYFNQDLQNEVLKKFHSSLIRDGYLSVGLKESLVWCDYGNRFTAVNNDVKIYRKTKE